MRTDVATPVPGSTPVITVGTRRESADLNITLRQKGKQVETGKLTIRKWSSVGVVAAGSGEERCPPCWVQLRNLHSVSTDSRNRSKQPGALTASHLRKE